MSNKYKKVLAASVVAIVFAGLCGCGRTEPVATEPAVAETETVTETKPVEEASGTQNSVDRQFVSDLSDALVARWIITDSKENKDAKAELEWTETAEEREFWQKPVNAELDVLAKGDYKNASFDDPELGEQAKSYIACLEDCLEATNYVTSDYDKFQSGWEDAQNRRYIIVANMVNKYGLSVPDDYKGDLEAMVGNASGTELTENTEGPIFKDNTYTCEKFTITITDYKVIPPGAEGNKYGDKPVIAFWYDVTNLADDSLSTTTAWITTFQAIQDNDPNMVNELNVGALPDSRFLDSQTADIKIGGTVSGAISYELTDDITPVTLEAYSLYGDIYGSQDYDIKQ